MSVLTPLGANVEPDDGRRGAGSESAGLQVNPGGETRETGDFHRPAWPLKKKLILAFARKTTPARSRGSERRGRKGGKLMMMCTGRLRPPYHTPQK